MSAIDAEALVTWLRAQLDEDERDVVPKVIVHSGGDPAPVVPNCIGVSGYGCELGGWSIDPDRVQVELWPDVEREHTRLHTSPAQLRVLRDVEAKRRIIDECIRTLEYEDYGYSVAEFVLYAIAGAYADRPGYRQEWRP